ncbi:hypothetical protein [Roseovarius nanhaiticus]|uniref:hypothetical protein n=1 Tax=Roseovarius nanhaiticus TaxID=573024 RepID=UPI00249305DC|nr:hypothetical protein [Roseovarius nanhaiticus]
MKRNSRNRSIGVGQSLLSAALLFFPPALAAGASVLTIPVFGVGMRIYKPIAITVTLLCLTTIFALIATFVNAGLMDEAIESLKFLFMAFCLVSGFWLQAKLKDIQRLALILSTALVVWYTVSVQLGVALPDAFRPPDNNGSSILLFFLAFILTDNRNIFGRLIIIAFLGFFATLVDSRLLIVLLPLFFLSQPVSFSIGRVLLFVCLCIVVYIVTLGFGLWGNWSDFVRLEIYATTLRHFLQEGLVLIATGQGPFLEAINASLPDIISQRLELSHVHNAFFQVIGSYGLLPGLSFIGVFVVLTRTSIILSDDTVRNQTIFLISAMMIETLLSDSRIAYIAFLFIGLQIGAARRRNAERLALT